MKNTFLILCTALLTACGAPKNPVRLISTVDDATSTTVTYDVLTPGFNPHEAQIAIPAERSGEDGYALPDDGQIYLITVCYNDSPDQNRYVVLMPGEQATLSGQLNIGTSDPNVIISGTDIFDTMYREMEQVKPQTKRISLLMRMKEGGGSFTPEEQREYDSLKRWSQEYVADRILHHPESPSTAYYMLARMFPDSCYTRFYNSLPQEVLNGKYKQLYDLIRPEEAAKPRQ